METPLTCILHKDHQIAMAKNLLVPTDVSGKHLSVLTFVNAFLLALWAQ